jgi:hypothetical protein
MENKTIFLLIILFIIVLILLYLSYYVYKLPKPEEGNCDYLKSADPSIKWSNNCQYIQELTLDSTIKTPQNSLYLSKFTNSPSLGSGWGVNVWYRYRNVNSKTGAYGKFSPWTKSPISAGSNNLPCQQGPGKCSSGFQNVGKDSCQSNLPELSVDSLDYSLTSDFFVNVHRYVTSSSNNTPPGDNITDNIVGMMLPNPSGKGGIFIDTSSSPCLEMSCNNIVGC